MSLLLPEFKVAVLGRVVSMENVTLGLRYNGACIEWLSFKKKYIYIYKHILPLTKVKKYTWVKIWAFFPSTLCNDFSQVSVRHRTKFSIPQNGGPFEFTG